ncbi:MAG TPA: 50S ribosomal protein L4 [Candidatus Hydrothermia bacterium]|nr:50S ribosomal protein L4 [Candidatus Hydrothermae bacterium]MDD3648925.1 50S ribosomal protein L4 [Candidatus Hydrothermia bacterium]HOK23166.1 50S ribosomal protein L4 [Candidatus Hydrothermia bacterium]HOL23870.1 50S ribosomal protein L4 [Candidatus Hydrothermia bacterium]HOP31873.1 50S ribosomal protein L4 [Candidatus Hydrothermia bacterium]
MKAPLYNENGELVGEMELKDELFGVEPKHHLLWEVSRMYMANKRQGTHFAKTRAEVVASGRKLFPQKGLGRSRHGDIKAPIFVGGGKAHGPRPREYYYEIPTRMKKLALLYSLADKAQHGRIYIIERFDFTEPKTRRMAELLEKIGLDEKKTLILSSVYNRNLYLSGRNIPFCDVMEVRDVNPVVVMNSSFVLIEKEGIGKLEKRLVI